MKQYPRIAARLYCEPWCIRSEVHSDLSRRFREHCESSPSFGRPASAMPTLTPVDGAADPAGTPFYDFFEDRWKLPPQVRVFGSLAILPVHGIIGKYLESLDLMCGGVDLNTIARQAKNIAADPAIKTVLVDIRSPGGVGLGLEEVNSTLQDITAAGKRLVAYADYECASAGYSIAAACQEIWAAPSAVVGSISTFIAALDASRAFEMEGLEVLMFRTGEVKGVGAYGKAWTPQEKSYMQSVVDMHGNKFKSWITSRRGLTDEHMQGQWWEASVAPAGVIDGIARDLDDMIAELI